MVIRKNGQCAFSVDIVVFSLKIEPFGDKTTVMVVHRINWKEEEKNAE